MYQKPERLYLLAQKIAERSPDFFKTKGPGRGDYATSEFMKKLREDATHVFAKDFSEKKSSDDSGFLIDFYFPDEATAVEVSLSLHRNLTEYERDIFKCLLALDSGCQIKRLVFIGKPGAIKRQTAPGPKSIANFVRNRYGLEVDILELVPPEP